MNMRTYSAAVFIVFGIAISPHAHAQTKVPKDSAIEVNLFAPAVGTRSFLTVSGADVQPDQQISLSLLVDYMTDPLKVYDYDQDDTLMGRTDVVKSVFTGQLGGAYGLGDRFQLGVSLPVILDMRGDGLDPNTANAAHDGGLSVMGLGDLHTEFKWRFFARQGLEVAAIPVVTLPTSTALGSEDNAYLGDDLPSFRPRMAVLLSDRDRKVEAGFNLGLVLRKPRTVYSTDVSQQLIFGAAAAFHLNPRVDLIAEVFGRNGFTRDLSQAPLEADAAVRINASRAYSVLLGGGAGLLKGLGSPGMRVFASVMWSPDFRDSDNDGIDNMRDRCIELAEDKDGFQDEDGCPDPDNDGDMIADAQDQCPNQAEDKEGFQDDDGCPDPDNDNDGFLDENDLCTNEAEDKLPPHPKDGCPADKRDSDDDTIADARDQCIDEPEDLDRFNDDDGCPDLDNDEDGVPDEYDTTCPDDAEDMDGFEDEDGCPERDNDRDGFADAQDKCPNDPETVNGVDDTDGCPDQGGRVLASFEGIKIGLAEAIGFLSTDAPKQRSREVLDQAALVMRAQAQIEKWRVVVAAESQGRSEKTRSLSQRRADNVKQYLVAKGVAAERIEAVGAVSDTPTTVIVAIDGQGGTQSETPENPTEGHAP